MDKETLIRLANEAGIKGPAPARAGFKMYASPDRLRRFAALIAAAERVACAQVCDGYEHADPLGVSIECASAIRARI